jgi:hypothetical protein
LIFGFRFSMLGQTESQTMKIKHQTSNIDKRKSKTNMKYLNFTLLFPLIIFAFACTQKEDKQTASNPDFNNVKVTVNIQHLDKEMFACQSKDELLEFFDKYPTFISDYFQVSSADFDKLAEQFLPLIQNQGLRDFYKQSQEPAFFGGQALENEFRSAFQHIKYYYPNFKEPKIYTIFSGFFNQFNLKDPELMVSDSAIYIGLDYFMGKKGKYLPDIYDFQLRKAPPDAIVIQTVLLLSQRYNAMNPKDKTLLSEMVWYGRSYVFAHTMMPNTEDGLFIGYSSQQLTDTYTYQKDIWGHYIQNQLLYTTQAITP